MDTTADIWREQMLQAQRTMLEVQGRRIRSLERLLHSVLDMVQGGFSDSIPVAELREAISVQLLPLPGVVPAQPLAQEDTSPIRNADPPDTFQGAPTQELPTLVAQGLEVES